MPTVVLLDVSLSMTRRVQLDNDSEMQMIHLARDGVSHFFTALSSKCKLEFSSLVAFSSRWEIVVPFTRDYQALKEGLLAVDIYDKTCIETALQGVETLVMEDFGATVPIHLVLVVDSCIGVGTGSLKESLTNRGDTKFPLPFPFPCYISVVCLGKAGEFSSCQRWFHRLVELNQGKGEIITPEMPLTETRVQQCFNRVIQSHYDQYMGTLACGNLKSHVTLNPYPDFRSSWSDVLNRYREKRDDVSYLQMPEVIPIVGFLDIADVSSPSYISRHLVLTIAKPKTRKTGSAKRMKQEGSSSSAEEEGKVPSFCVLLHGSLKIEKMVAIVQLGDNWYGMLYSWSDNKKKSSLMLAVFEPRHEISWLGNFKSLGPSAELPLNPYQYDHKEDAEDTPFPIPPTKRKSYHIQPSLVWVRNTGLQADIQKVLSHAKKLPEKQTSFFKEVNRIRRAAVCYNFTDLLHYVADAIEREAKSHPHETARQLNHAAESLRQAFKREIVQNIVPLDKSILRV